MPTYNSPIVYTEVLGSLSSPGDGIVRITPLTQVKKETETSVRASNLDPETGSPVYTKHQATTQDKSLSPQQHKI